jgi:hypothetical protein
MSAGCIDLGSAIDFLFRDLGAPLIGAQVFRVLRKNPEVPFQILHGILQFAVDSLMKLLDKTNPRRFHFSMMRIDIVEKNRQALQVVSKFRRSGSIRLGGVRHDVSVRQPQLRSCNLASGRIDVVILLDEPKMLYEPVDCSRQIAIRNVRQNGIDRHRAILHSGWMIVAEIRYRVYKSLCRDHYAGFGAGNRRRSKRANRRVG